MPKPGNQRGGAVLNLLVTIGSVMAVLFLILLARFLAG